VCATLPGAADFEPAFAQAARTTLHGGLVIHHRGRLVFERYFGLGHRDATANLASCGKSFTSVAMGILLEERRDLFPERLDTKVFDARYLPIPVDDPAKGDIRLGHLLTMTAGIRGNNPGMMQGREMRLDPPGPDGAEAMRDSVAAKVGLWCKPGEGYSYATSSIHLVSMILRHVTGMELEDYVAAKLAKPLGWQRWSFGYKQAKLGHTPGGGGIALRAEDMIRFGRMLLAKGKWNGRQVVPAWYVEHLSRQSPYNPHAPYSLQFDVNTDGHRGGLPRDAYWKTGSGGHALYIIPSLDLIVWKLGGRTEQYRPENTGLPPSPAPYNGERDGMKLIPDDHRTIELVVEALRK
jgi:CubicO group peptidase (beta-lactamase class C family)